MNKKTLSFIRGTLMWFLIFYLGFSFWQSRNAEAPAEADLAAVALSPITNSVPVGNLVSWSIEGSPSALQTACGDVRFYRTINGKSIDITPKNCAECGTICSAIDPENERNSLTFQAASVQNKVFTEAGNYSLGLGEFTSTPVEIKKPGVFRQLFRGVIKQPLFNLLAWLTNVLPGNSFGWAIVLLTLIVRLLLFIPNQRAMRGQQAMQHIQPQLQEIQRKYKNDQQALAAKTMELYKTHKINPLSSCMPMLLQLPFLLGVYYIVQEGLSPHLQPLLYSFQDGLNLSAGNLQFFGLDLSKANVFPLPILVAVAQWFALRFMMRKAPNAAASSGMAGQMQQMQKVMQWAMPLMIGFFTATFPAGVGIYWLTSTLFGVGQQWLIKRQMDKPQVRVKQS